ncbi:MAG: flagellar export protein FliJ [Dehalococcoidia bacterium]|nr:flagellar export protein FliJ [Dehalococcoidia bacterium]
MSLTPQRLKRLVRYRERLERLQELELARAMRLYNVRASALEAATGDRDRALDSGNPPAGPVFVADLLSGIDYLQRADREIAAKRAALAHSENDVAEEREVLLGRRRDRKAMETLLDRRLEEDRIGELRAETRRIDELAITRWKRPGAPGERSA